MSAITENDIAAFLAQARQRLLEQSRAEWAAIALDFVHGPSWNVSAITGQNHARVINCLSLDKAIADCVQIFRFPSRDKAKGLREQALALIAEADKLDGESGQ